MRSKNFTTASGCHIFEHLVPILVQLLVFIGVCVCARACACIFWRDACMFWIGEFRVPILTFLCFFNSFVVFGFGRFLFLHLLCFFFGGGAGLQGSG